MPKIEKPPYSVRRVWTNPNSKYAKEKWQLLGRAKIFGCQIRKYRATKKAAEELGEKYLGELREHGQQATPLSDIERAGAVQAIRLLGDSGDLVTAVKFFLKFGRRRDDITVAEAAGLFAQTRGIPREVFNKKKGAWRRKIVAADPKPQYSNPHRLTLQSRLERFITVFGAESVRTFGVRATEVRAYLKKNWKNQRTLQNQRSTLHSFFAWCVEQNHCSANPAIPWTEQKQELRAYAKQHQPQILTAIELRDLLHTAQVHDPEMIPYIVIAAYSGVRPEELRQMRWENVKDGFIYILNSLSKTGDSAELKIHRPLKRWLSIVRQKSGPIAPKDCARRRLALWRRIHGVDPLAATTAQKQACPKWPLDGFRHSFGTYRYKITGDIGLVSAEMRHEDPVVFRKYYLKRGVTKADATAYFAVTPLSVQALRIAA
jgi:integrase